MYDKNWKEIFPEIYDNFTLTHNYFIVKKDWLEWLYDKTWKEILWIKYDKLSYARINELITKDKWKYWVIDFKGKVLIENKYDYLEKLNNWKYYAKLDNKFWIVDENWKIVIPFLYWDLVLETIEKKDYYIVKELFDWKKWMIEEDGKYYIEVGGENSTSKKWVLDENNKFLINMNYDNIFVSKNNYFIVYENEEFYWVVDLKWKLVIPAKYKEISVFDDWNFLVKNNNLVWLYDVNWKELIPVKYEDIRYENIKKWYVVKISNWKNGYIDSNFKQIVNANYDYISISKDNKLFLIKNNVTKVYDKNWKNILTKPYFIVNYSNWVYFYYQNDNYGMLDEKWNILTKNIFNSLNFVGNIWTYSVLDQYNLGKLYWYIDNKWKYLTSAKFSEAYPFDKWYWVVVYGQLYWIIDEKLNVKYMNDYQYLSDSVNWVNYYKKDWKYWFLKLSEKYDSLNKYDHVERVYSKWILCYIVEDNWKYLILNKDLKVLIENKFGKIYFDSDIWKIIFDIDWKKVYMWI